MSSPNTAPAFPEAPTTTSACSISKSQPTERLWSEPERLLFAALRPYLSSTEIREVFLGLGFDRSVDAIGSRGRRVGILFRGLGIPDMQELAEEARAWVNEALTRREEEGPGNNEGEEGDPELPSHNIEESDPPAEPQSILWQPGTRIPRLVAEATAKDLLDKLCEIHREITAEKIVPIAEPTRGAGKSTILLLTDLHFGGKTQDFNIEVAEQRIVGIPDQLIPLLPEGTDEVIVCIGGDVVDGELIYPSHQSHLSATLLNQVEVATRALWTLICKFANQGYKTRIITSPGNHGRMSKNADEHTNWDNVVYMQLGILARMTSNLPIVTQINFEEFVRFPIRDRWGLMYHWGVKHLGTPAMKIKLAGWNHTWPWDVFLHGHHHQWGVGTIFGKPVVRNGSLIGPDDLARRMGESDPPRQTYFFAEEGKPFYGFSYLEW